MKLTEIHQLAIELGIKNDLRPRKVVEKDLTRIKKQFEKLSPEKKELFFTEKLTNPYLDSTINFNNEKDIKKIMVGIDIDASELLIAEKLGIDAVLAHHPSGTGLTFLHEVMKLQIDVLEQYGIPINIAENLLHLRIDEVARRFNPSNHFKTVMAAKNLNISLMNNHTGADNMAATFLKNLMIEKKPEYIYEILDILREIPEYRNAEKNGVGPTLFSGRKESRTGKIAVTEITGGTEGNHKIYQALANAGIGTVLSMHQSEKHKKAAAEAHINVVIVGHMASDSLGMNLFLDELEKKGIEIVPAGGLDRCSRVKK